VAFRFGGTSAVLWIQFGNVKEGRMKDFQEWSKKNETLMQKHMPPGWAYRGTYAAVLGFGKYDVATIFECRKYGDFDALREHREETWDRLYQEAVEFFMPGSGEAILLRELSDTKIMEPKKETKKPTK
jgi:hypothetical protein